MGEADPDQGKAARATRHAPVEVVDVVFVVRVAVAALALPLEVLFKALGEHARLHLGRAYKLVLEQLGRGRTLPWRARQNGAEGSASLRSRQGGRYCGDTLLPLRGRALALARGGRVARSKRCLWTHMRIREQVAQRDRTRGWRRGLTWQGEGVAVHDQVQDAGRVHAAVRGLTSGQLDEHNAKRPDVGLSEQTRRKPTCGVDVFGRRQDSPPSLVGPSVQAVRASVAQERTLLV